MTAERAANTGARRRVARLRDPQDVYVSSRSATGHAALRGGRDSGKAIHWGRGIQCASARAVGVSLQRARGGREALTSGGSVKRRAEAWREWGQPAGPPWNSPARGQTSLGGGREGGQARGGSASQE